jgi:iron complex outermembrane receptor protein
MFDFNAKPAVVESRRPKARTGLGMCLAVGAAGALCNVALAQQAGQAANAAPSNEQDQLTEVIVTAERREVDLQKAAVSVSVRTGENLAEHGKFAISEILEDVPGVVVEPAIADNSTGLSDSPSSRISIRGVGANERPAGSGLSEPSGVAEYVDGVYNGIGDTYDINRVEVSRGPQGTLYGRSATAGVVAVHTMDPVVGEFNGTATAEFGDFDLRHYSAGLNIPVDSVAAVRLSGNDYARDGYYAPQGGAEHTTDGRLKLLVKPTDNLSILLGVALQNNIERSGQLSGVMNPEGRIAYTQGVPLGTGHDDTRQYWAQIDWNLGFGTLTYQPSLRNWVQHATTYAAQALPGVVLVTDEATPYDQFHTEELRLSSNPGSRINWQTGVFFYNNEASNVLDKLVGTGPIFPPSGILLQDSLSTRDTRNLGVFAEAGFPLTDTLSLTAGARYDYTRIEPSGTNSTNAGGSVTLDLTTSEGTRVTNNGTYKLRLEDNLTASNLLYASVSTAFLPGDVVIAAGPTGGLAITPYQAETLTSFELGSKNRFLDDRLQVNGALFYYRYGGYQQTVQIGIIPPGLFLFNISNSPARMIGGELELLYRPLRSDQFGLNVSVLNPYYVDKPPVFATGVAQSKIPGIVPLTVDPSYSHIFAFGGNQTLTMQVDALYNGSYDVNAITSAIAAQGGENYIKSGSHVVGNFSASWGFWPKSSLSLWVRNVTNERYNTWANPGSITPTLSANGTLHDPRTLGVALRSGF